MLTIISWRNVWRSRSRSLVVIGAIIIGIWALSLAMGFAEGFTKSYLDNAINYQYAHLQLHAEGYQANKDPDLHLDEGLEMTSGIQAAEGIEAVTARTVVQGMVASAQTASGVQIYGINPETERAVFRVHETMEEGTFLPEEGRNPVVIGTELAEKLHVELRSKIVLTFTDTEGNLISGAFRVAGIFNTRSPVLNQAAAFVQRSDLARLLGREGMIHEIALRAENPETLEALKQQLQETYPGVEVQTWQDLAPELELISSQTSTSLIVLLVIIMLALGFGIVNTMLMSVLERIKELGMLMAVGMHKSKVFFMIILETMMISLVGGPLGLLAGFASVRFFQQNGLDLSSYAQGLDQFGYESILRPELSPEHYLMMTLGVVITAILGSVYPAYKAIRLKPVEALSKL